MITKKTVFVVSHDDPLAYEFSKALREEDGWEMEYDTVYAVYTKIVAVQSHSLAPGHGSS